MKKDIVSGDIAFSLVRRNMKNIRIHVTGDRRVVVSAPHRCAESHINAFVRENDTYIRQRLCALEMLRRRHYPAAYTDGDSFSFLGERVTLRVTRAEKASAALKDHVLYMFVPPDGDPKKVFVQWYTKQARLIFAKRLAIVSPGFEDVPTEELRISARCMLTRWGSIHTVKKRINLSVYLLRCEPELIDYVLCHELCHLHYRSHSAAFYRDLMRHCPQRKALDKRLDTG